MDASCSGASTPPLWHIDAVRGRGRRFGQRDRQKRAAARPPKQDSCDISLHVGETTVFPDAPPRNTSRSRNRPEIVGKTYRLIYRRQNGVRQSRHTQRRHPLAAQSNRRETALQRCPSSAPWSSFWICSMPCARAFASDASARSDRCISLPCLRMAHSASPFGSRVRSDLQGVWVRAGRRLGGSMPLASGARHLARKVLEAGRHGSVPILTVEVAGSIGVLGDG